MEQCGKKGNCASTPIIETKKKNGNIRERKKEHCNEKLPPFGVKE